MAPTIMNGNSHNKSKATCPRTLRNRGHILLVAIVLAALMSIMMAMALAPVRTAKQRLLERELIYRGEHIADGIRRYYLKKGRFPFTLEELVENEPFFIRKLYADPMTKHGEWTLVYLTPLDRKGVQGLNILTKYLNLADPPETELNSENIDENQPGLSRDPNSVFQIKDQQITGIRSQSNEEGLTERGGSRIYGDWLFSAVPQRKEDLDEISNRIQNLLNRK